MHDHLTTLLDRATGHDTRALNASSAIDNDVLRQVERYGFGQFLLMGLIGVALASVIGLFWHSHALQFVISLAGVIVFAGLAAYDAQRLNDMADATPAGHAGAYAISGALALYLDFVNLFVFLLRFVGRRRD